MVSINVNQPIAQKFDEEIGNLRNHVLKMGGLVEQQISTATYALRRLDSKQAEEVIRQDKHINALEVSVDEQCARILVRRQLAASDLRMIVAVIKTITDFERTGDVAERIAKMAINISGKDCLFHDRYIGITHLSEHVISMEHKTLDAFARLVTDEAFDGVRDDEKADVEYQSIMRQLLTHLMEDPGTISESRDITQAAPAIERIGDHAMNIVEYIIYLVLGKDIRHTSMQDLERGIVS